MRAEVKINQSSRKHQFGGAALEYILISTFAAVVTIAALGFIGKAVHEQLVSLAEKLGMDDVPDFDLPFTGNR